MYPVEGLFGLLFLLWGLAMWATFMRGVSAKNFHQKFLGISGLGGRFIDSDQIHS